jgi:hypothetical protein
MVGPFIGSPDFWRPHEIVADAPIVEAPKALIDWPIVQKPSGSNNPVELSDDEAIPKRNSTLASPQSGFRCQQDGQPLIVVQFFRDVSGQIFRDMRGHWIRV